MLSISRWSNKTIASRMLWSGEWLVIASLSSIHVCCLCLFCLRLRDLSAQDKLDQQRVMKDLEKTGADLTQMKEQKEKITRELLVSFLSLFSFIHYCFCQ